MLYLFETVKKTMKLSMTNRYLKKFVLNIFTAKVLKKTIPCFIYVKLSLFYGMVAFKVSFA